MNDKKNKSKHTRIPMLLSAFVCPGTGQFVQQRWFAGLVYATGFLIAFIWIMVIAIQILIDFYRMAFEFETYEPGEVHLSALLVPLGIAITLYVANIFDVFFAQVRGKKVLPSPAENHEAE